VKAHLGSIGVRSAPGDGAEFLVALPGLREARPPELGKAPLDDEEKAAARERRRARAEARLRRRRKKKQA
jgi:two-component system, NtrC family, sensor histidine kinase HydH